MKDPSGNDRWHDDSGLLHRLDGPALVTKFGDMRWYQYGQLHREEGPAIKNNSGYQAWYYRGKFIDVGSQEEFKKFLVN